MSSNCIICAVNLSQHDFTQVSSENAVVYGAVFQTFCKYFALTRVNEEHPLDFHNELFPFCDTCRDDIGHLFILNSKLDSLQTKISKMVAKISHSIIRNASNEVATTITTTKTIRRGGNFVGPKRRNPNYVQDAAEPMETEVFSSSRKVLRYRKTIIKQYNPTVVLRRDDDIQIQKQVVQPNNNNKSTIPGHNFQSSTSGAKTRSGRQVKPTASKLNDHYDEDDDDGYEDPFDSYFDDNYEDEDYSFPSKKKSKPALQHNNVPAVIKQEPIDDYADDDDYDDDDPIAEILDHIQNSENATTTTTTTTTLIDGTEKEALYFCTWPVVQKGSVHLCKTCGVTPANKRGLYLHIKQQHGDPRKLFCSICEDDLSTEDDFKSHITSLHPHLIEDAMDQIISCGLGRFLYKGRWYFEETENEFQCGVCGRVWRKRKDLLQHLEHHKDDAAVDGTEKFKCAQCNLTFSTYMRRRYHIRSVHRQNQTICCRHCGEAVGSKLQLALHRTSGACKDGTLKMEPVNDFTCPACSKTLMSLQKYLLHLKSTHPSLITQNNIIECGHGNLLCDNKWLLIKRKGWQCNFCQAIVPTRQLIRSHIESHPGVICPVCGKTFRNNFSLGAHHRTAHRDVPAPSNRERFYCRKLTGLYYELWMPKNDGNDPDTAVDPTTESTTNNTTETTTTFADATVKVEEEAVFKCSICDYLGKTHPEMIQHMEVHSDNPTGKKRKRVVVTTGKGKFLYCGKWPFTEEEDGRFKCSTCHHTFKRRQDIVGHQRMAHDKSLVIVCEICGKEFNWQQSFNLHMATHSDLKAVKCDSCDYTCNTSSHLYAHRKTVHEAKPHPCDQCEKVYKTKAGLIKHMQSHSGTRKGRPKKKLSPEEEAERPHVCDYCPMRFKSLQGSTRHMNDIHSGEWTKDTRPQKKPGKKRGRPKKRKPWGQMDMTSSESEEEEEEEDEQDFLEDDDDDDDDIDENGEGQQEQYQPNNMEVGFQSHWTQ